MNSNHTYWGGTVWLCNKWAPCMGQAQHLSPSWMPTLHIESLGLRPTFGPHSTYLMHALEGSRWWLKLLSLHGRPRQPSPISGIWRVNQWMEEPSLPSKYNKNVIWDLLLTGSCLCTRNMFRHGTVRSGTSETAMFNEDNRKIEPGPSSGNLSKETTALSVVRLFFF